ncbi:hypothetical protein V1525DRAFT_385195 [Lipomyces kononenkoae]|uniref:Uncharacterized protein n=1 Tax=Lipomyces kononenkoae TaxID=34357 RepID=A0ACC3TB91_LIPKO
MSGTSAACDLMEFYVVGNFRPLRIDSERYDAVVKASGPPLCYFDEDGDRITVGSSRELRDRIVELQGANKSVVFALTAKAGREWYDTECADTLIVQSTGRNIDSDATRTSMPSMSDAPTPAVTAISRTDSVTPSADYTIIDYADVPTPEGPISEVASTADDEESAQRPAPESTQGQQFSDRLIAAFENMMSDTESMSLGPSSMTFNQEPDNYSDGFFSEFASTTSSTAPRESLPEALQSTSSLATVRPQDLRSTDFSSSPRSEHINGNWADTLSESIRRAIQQLQEVANGNGNPSSQGLFEMDPALADNVADLVRKIVQKINANISAADRAFPNTSTFTRDTMERTLGTFQDFAAQIGHVALIGGYQAAAASREAADIGLQATREAIRAARENTQVATYQLQQCLREIAAQFNESVNTQRQEASREEGNRDLLNQINEMWNESQLGREEAESQTGDSIITPPSIGSAGGRYFNETQSQGGDDDDPAAVPAPGSPPELPGKIPIKQGAVHYPQFGSTSSESVYSRRAASIPGHSELDHPSPPPPSSPYRAHDPGMAPRVPGSTNGFEDPFPFPRNHNLGAPAPRPPPPPPPSDSTEWHYHGHQNSRDAREEREAHFNWHRRHADNRAPGLSRPHDQHRNFDEFSRSLPGHYDQPRRRGSDVIDGSSSSCPPWYQGRRHAPPGPDPPFAANFSGLPHPPSLPLSRTPRYAPGRVVNYALPSMSAFQDFGDFTNLVPSGSEGTTTELNTRLSGNETVNNTDSHVIPSAPQADYISAEDAEWGEVASELRGSVTPVASVAEAVKDLKLEDEKLTAERARYQDEVQIERVMSPEHGPTVEASTASDAGNPWSQADGDAHRDVRAPQELGGAHIYHRQPNRGEVEDVGPAQDPLTGLSRTISYTDAPGMPPSPQAILQEGVREDPYYPNGRSYEPSISSFTPAPSYHTAPSIRSAQLGSLQQETSGVSSRIQAIRRHREDGRGSRSRQRRQPNYIEMRQLSPDAQDRADINRLGLENEANDAERECARQMVELELISPDNMAMAIYYAQQAKGDLVDAIDLLEADLKQLETYEARNRPVTNTANPLAAEPGE